jgi:hypothetical protein
MRCQCGTTVAAKPHAFGLLPLKRLSSRSVSNARNQRVPATALYPRYLSAKVKMLLPEATAMYWRPFSM